MSNTKQNYKQTEIEENPSDWKITELGLLTKNYDSKRIPLSKMQRQNRKGIYPYYGASGIIDHVDDYIFDGRYLLVSEDGENLRSRKQPINYIVNGKFWVNNHAHILKANNQLDLDFLYYWFFSNSISPYLSGSVQPKLSQKNLNKIKILHPNIEEQKRISSILASLDEKIELNLKMNQTLEEMGKALFKHWFVDFEFPDKDGNPYKSSGGKMVDSEIGKIPKKWKIVKLTEVCEIDKGLSYKSKDLTKNKTNIGLINLKNFNRNGGFRTDGVKFYKGNTYKKQHIVKSGDLILAMTDLTQERDVIASPVLIPSLDIETLIISLDVVRLKVKKEAMISNEYLYLSLLLPSIHAFLLSYTSGTTVLHLKKQGLEKTCLIIPPVEIMANFNILFKPFFNKINITLQQNRKLNKIQKLLLPRLMSGKLRV